MGAVNNKERTMQDNQMADAVIKLHEIARMIESKIGQGLLSDDVRDCANRLHMISRPAKPVQEQTK
jgi:hypothetical protein